MALLLKESVSNIECGLGTFQFTVGVAGYFLMNAICTENPVSGLTISLQKNGSSVNSGTIASSAQNNINVRQDNISCAIGDVLSFVISSSNTNDTQNLNNIKTLLVVTRVG